MSEVSTMRFVLVGAHAGKTIKLGKYQFVDGVYEHKGPLGGSEGAARYLRKSYQAFPEGSLELKLAQSNYKKLIGEMENGECGPDENAEPNSTESVPGNSQPDWEGPAEEDSDDDGGDNDTEEGDPGLRSEGDGEGEGCEEADLEE